MRRIVLVEVAAILRVEVGQVSAEPAHPVALLDGSDDGRVCCEASVEEEKDESASSSCFSKLAGESRKRLTSPQRPSTFKLIQESQYSEIGQD